MSKDDVEFTPERVEEQIDQLLQAQRLHLPLSSEAPLVPELYQVYAEDCAIIENAWQRLSVQTQEGDAQAEARHILMQSRSQVNVLREPQKGPQSMQDKALEKSSRRKLYRLLELCAAILVIIALVAGTTIVLHSVQHQPATSHPGENSLHVVATATSSPDATVLLADPLKENRLHLLVDDEHFFQDRAYHIDSRRSTSESVGVVIPKTFNDPDIAYQLTMQEIRGDDTDGANTFGLIFDYHAETAPKRMTFYEFSITNNGARSQYALYKYDSSKSYPWSQVGKTMQATSEFHAGHSAGSSNVVKVIARNGSFTFLINDRQVGTARDTTLRPGSMGMWVNLRGTEVAFSDLLVTRV